MTGPEFLALGRLARRTARRNWLRTALIVALIAIPVAAAQIAAGFFAASKVTQEDFAAHDFGAADFRIEGYGATSEVREWLGATIAELAPEASVLQYNTIYGAAPGVSPWLAVTDLDLSNPIARGMNALTEGALPTSADQIAVSEALLTLGDLQLGDTIAIAAGSGVVDDIAIGEFVISGVVRDALDVRARFAVVTPEALKPTTGNESPGIFVEARWLLEGGSEADLIALEAAWNEARLQFLPEPAVTPRPASLAGLSEELYRSLTAEQIAQLKSFVAENGTAGLEEQAYRTVDFYYDVSLGFLHRDHIFCCGPEDGVSRVLQAPSVLGSLGAALLLAEVALVAGAAYATGTRRRLRELGLMAVNGATDQHLRWAVVGEGLVAGVLGAAIGTTLGVSALVFARPVMQQFVSRLIVGVPIGPLELLGPALVGIAAATLAAWVPARTAARVPATTALQGRMPLKAPRRWVVPLGLGMSGFGSFLVIVAKTATGDSGTYQAGLGVVLMIGGFALLAGPMVAWVGNRADRLPAMMRLVARDSARQRTRAATAVAATMVVVLAPILIGVAVRTDARLQSVNGLPADGRQVLVGSYDWQALDQVEPVGEGDLDAVRAVLPDAVQATLFGRAGYGVLAEFEAAAGGRVGSPAADSSWSSAALGIAEVTPEILDLLGLNEALDDGEQALVLGRQSRSVEVVVGGTRVPAREVPVAMMHYYPPRLLLMPALADQLELARNGQAVLFVNPDPLTETERLELQSLGLPMAYSYRETFTSAQIELMGMGAAMVVVLVIIGLVTALSATESDHDLRTMVAIGAPPRIRRQFLGSQSAYYTLFAALLATPLGLLLYKVSVTNWGTAVGPFGAHQSDSVVVPWREFGMVGIGIPLAIGLITAVTVRSAATTPPQRTG